MADIRQVKDLTKQTLRGNDLVEAVSEEKALYIITKDQMVEGLSQMIDLFMTKQPARFSGEFLQRLSDFYDGYSAIPSGNYFTFHNHSFGDFKNFADVQSKGGVHQWISRKPADGFAVTRNFFQYPFDSQAPNANLLVRERDFSINWELQRGHQSMYVSPVTSWLSWMGKPQVYDEQGIRDAIHKTFQMWSDTYARFIDDDIRDEMEGVKAQIKLDDINDAQGKNFKTWDEYFNHIKSEEGFVPTGHYLVMNNAFAEGIGFWPETESVKGPKELADFVIRFLNYEEKGKPFEQDLAKVA